MAEILSFARLRQSKKIQQSAFRQLLNDHLWADLSRKMEMLRSFGNSSATIQDGGNGSDKSCDHVTLLFSGTGPLEGCSFGFSIRYSGGTAIKAEILVFHSETAALLARDVGSCDFSDYSRDWLFKSYDAALEIITPISQPSHSSAISRT